MDLCPGLLCPGVSPPPPLASKIWKSPQKSAYLLGGVLACRSLLLASRGSPGLAGSGAGAVVLGTCGGAGGGAGFFTAFSLFDRMEGQTWWRDPANDLRVCHREARWAVDPLLHQALGMFLKLLQTISPTSHS